VKPGKKLDSFFYLTNIFFKKLPTICSPTKKGQAFKAFCCFQRQNNMQVS
jgi:hypothetical protein